MSTEKKVYVKHTGPVGIAVFPYLIVPDTKFKDVGEFVTRVRVPVADAAALQAKLDKMLPEHIAAVKAQVKEEMKEAKGKKLADLKAFLTEMPINALPIKPAYDDEGNETDEVEISYKRAAKYKDRKTGELKDSFVTIFDAKGVKIPRKTLESMSIWGGSTIEVACTLLPYRTPKGVGIKLALDAARIVKLVSGGGNADAESYGFGKSDDEDGFDSSTVEVKEPVNADGADSDGGEEGTDDVDF